MLNTLPEAVVFGMPFPFCTNPIIDWLAGVACFGSHVLVTSSYYAAWVELCGTLNQVVAKDCMQVTLSCLVDSFATL